MQEQPTQIEDALLSEDDVAPLLNLKPRTLTVWRCTGRGPKYLKIGRKVFYRRSAVEAFIAGCAIDPSLRGEIAQ